VSRAKPLILAVDDQPANLALLRKLVRRLGYGLVEASTGNAALKALTELEPDLVLLDVMLPDLNGFEVCQQIRAQPRFAGLPILLLTSLTATEDKAKGLEAGANDFLPKPFEEVELIARVRSLLRTKALQDQLADILGRYVSGSVADRVLQDPAEALKLGGDRRTVTVLLADLRGYTSLADSSPPEVLLNLLNRYLSVATDVIQAGEGTVNDLLGDGVLAFFGAPVRHVDDARRAVVAALQLQAAVAEMELPELPGSRLQTGIGVSTGEAIAGNIGSERRMHYTVIGSPVSLAARLQIAAAPGQILTDEHTHSMVKDFVISQDMGTLGLAGRGESLQVFKIVGLKAPASA
jgi:class 3 adenylate cyclase